MKAIVSGAVYIPKKAIDVAKVKHALTVKYWQMGEQEATHVPAYSETKEYLVVPRAYGLKLIANNNVPAEYAIAAGVTFPFKKKVTHTGEYAYQNDFVKDILSCCDRHNDFIVQAATGKGKTVCSLSVIQKLGRNAIVIVDQENLMLQWRKQCKDVLGLADEEIGTVQGKVCDYEGKAVTIAMIQSLTQREYSEELYDHFGVLVVDEVHTAGAPTFSQALLMFSAEVRFGVSATVDRRDALQRILHWNLGEVEVLLEDKHDKSYLYYIESDTVYSWYANISPKVGRMLTEVAEDPVRNTKIVEAIMWLYESGRDVLVISDRIEQLENLLSMCYYEGVPTADLGLYCGFRNVWGYMKDTKPKRKPVGYEKGTEYTPVVFGSQRKRIPKKELEEIKQRAKIIFATFGMFAKGVDVPRLSGGIDCTPRSKAQQVHGRILRKLDGKHIPIWVTIRDVNSYKLEHQFLQRIDEYVSSSAEIYKWKPSKGVRLMDVKELRRSVRESVAELKALNITTCVDGNYTLVTPATPTELRKPQGIRTAKTIR